MIIELDHAVRQQVSCWRNAHDGLSLLAIRKNRDLLLHYVHGDETELSINSALALARLIDLDGAHDTLVEALQTAKRRSSLEDPRAARLSLALAQADFERGDLLGAREGLEALLASKPPEVRLTATLALVRVAKAKDQPALLEKARTYHQSLADPKPWLSALLASTEAQFALSQRQISVARGHWLHALELALSYGGELEAAVAVGCLGNLELDQDVFAAAAGWFEEAVRLGALAGSEGVQAIFLGYHGWTLNLQDDHALGDERLSESIVRCKKLGLHRFLYQFMCIQLVMTAGPEKLERREVTFHRTLGKLRATGDLDRANAVGHLGVFFQLERAANAKPEPAVRRLIGAYHALEGTPTSDDGRVALRQATRAFQRALHALPMHP